MRERATSPASGDIAARMARERAELAAERADPALALDACRMLSQLFGAGYRLTELLPSQEIAATPVRLRARHEGACAACGEAFAVGDTIWWTRGVSGVECNSCNTCNVSNTCNTSAGGVA